MEPNKISDYLKICKQIFKASTHEYLETWLKTCNPREIKGIKVIAAVIKHQGQKKFRPSHMQDIRNDEKDIRTRTMTSFYKSDYCLDSTINPVTIDIFNYAKLSELSYSDILSYESLIYLQRWINLKDESKYKIYLLEVLKGLYSVINTNKKAYRTSNEVNFSSFLKKKPLERKKSIEPAKPVFERRQNSTLKQRPLAENYKKISRSTNIGTYQPMFYENRMKKIMKGTDGILNWVHDKNESHYQETYTGKPSATQIIKPSLTSTVIKLIPI